METKKQAKTAGPGRREFLKLAGLGAVAGASAVAAPVASAVAGETAPQGRYRETELVRTAYKLARF